MGKNKISLLLGGLILYVASTGISLKAFSASGTSSNSGNTNITSPLAKTSGSPKRQFRIDPAIPRDQVCPLNGQMFTKQEKDVWDKRRPLTVMIENHEEARPQSGLSYADIVYEALAEGWITRFMGVYYCDTAAGNVAFAPVRSARTYFVDWVSEYDALYNHVGGAGRCEDTTVDVRAKALCQIDRFGIKDLDQFGIGFPDCYRNPDRLDHPVATEHQMVCFSDNLYKIGAKRGWTNVDEDDVSWDKNFTEWKFKDDAKEAQRGTPKPLKIVFAEGYDKFDVKWDYDKASNMYKRSNGEVPHLDKETGEQLAVKNVVVQISKLTGPVDEHAHILYQTIGNGKAIIFQDGKVMEGLWRKSSRTARTMFYDADGNPVEFSRGKIWIEIVPSIKDVSY